MNRQTSSDRFDVVAVGTGFATSFFLHRYLARSGSSVRVLVLEAGGKTTHAEQLAQAKNSLEHANNLRDTACKRRFVNRPMGDKHKHWRFVRGFGGTSVWWVACTPRMMPSDFRTRSLYGVGEDWPFDYGELEPYYCDAEDLMGVSGPSDDSPYPRSRPYPFGAYRPTEPDRALKRAFPDSFFAHPGARSIAPVPGQRGACCGSGVCQLCPVDAKFTVLNGMESVYADPRVELRTNAEVLSLDIEGGRVAGLVYRSGAEERAAHGDLVVLGANGFFNPLIMQNSGLDHPELGKGLCEQNSRGVFIELDGMNNYQGSSVSTGLGYMFYDGEHRKRKGAAMVQTLNRPELMHVRGRWLQKLQVNFVFEDFRRADNLVRPNSDDPTKPEAVFHDHSDSTVRGHAEVESDVQTLLAALPVKTYEIGERWHTDSHIMGTHVMGADPASSVTDPDGVHHEFRNLVVLGSGSFPTAACANPTLTLSAMALRSAERLTRSGAPA